jgi:ABC-type multidrug transport system permease subunit
MHCLLAIFNIISKFFLKLVVEMFYGNSKIIISSEIYNFLVAHFLIITRELPLSVSEIIAPFLSRFYFILFIDFLVPKNVF